MNNTPFNWKNETTFVPAKPPEKTMTTFEYLESAETALRSALKSVDSKAKSYQLRRIVELIGTVEDIKRSYKPSSTFTVGGSHEPFYGMYSACPLDSININAAQPVNIPGASGSDVITFS